MDRERNLQSLRFSLHRLSLWLPRKGRFTREFLNFQLSNNADFEDYNLHETSGIVESD